MCIFKNYSYVFHLGEGEQIMETSEKSAGPPDTAVCVHEGFPSQLDDTDNNQSGGQQTDGDQEMLSQDEDQLLPTGDQTGGNENSNQDDNTPKNSSQNQGKEMIDQGGQVDQSTSNGQENKPTNLSDQGVASTPDNSEADVLSKEPVSSSTDQADQVKGLSSDGKQVNPSEENDESDSQTTGDSQATTDSQVTEIIGSQDTEAVDGANAGNNSDDDYQSAENDKFSDRDTDSNGDSDDDERGIPRPWYQFWRSDDPVCVL